MNEERICRLNGTSGEGDCIIVLLAQTGGYTSPVERTGTLAPRYEPHEPSTESLTGACFGVLFVFLFLVSFVVSVAQRKRR
jgi:hypothetical protein